MSFEITGMTSGFVVMAAGEDGAAEGILWGNIDMSFICQDMVIEFPIREAGSESSGDVLQGRL